MDREELDPRVEADIADQEALEELLPDVEAGESYDHLDEHQRIKQEYAAEDVQRELDEHRQRIAAISDIEGLREMKGELDLRIGVFESRGGFNLEQLEDLQQQVRDRAEELGLLEQLDAEDDEDEESVWAL